MDRIIAIVLLIFLSPVILIALLITIIDLRCNPIFIQKRTLLGDEIFVFYKIRSMIKTAPVVPTAELLGAEKYITRWGKFLRSCSLDEILNLVCIVTGDMNFIGPRPIMENEFELLKLRKQNGIRSKPGITGLAQINGRDLISQQKKVACERYYEYRKSSIQLRIFILLKTVEVVIKKSGISH